MKRLYVGNLSYSITEDALKEEFSKYGEVESINLIRDRHNGDRLKGFGFVEMATADEANAVIAGLDGQEVMGREIKISIAREEEKREPRSGGGGFGSRPPRSGGNSRGGGGFSRDRRGGGNGGGGGGGYRDGGNRGGRY